MIYRDFHAWNKRRGHQRLRRIGRKVLHLTLTFALGVAVATAYHLLVTNQKVRRTAEAVCDNFGRDASECRNGIDDLLDESDNTLDNNINVNWIWLDHEGDYGTIRLERRDE